MDATQNMMPMESGKTLRPNTPPVEIKLFVGRVPRTYTEDNLRPLFAQFGEIVDMTVIRDRESGSHKGCGFIRMKSLAAADAAVRTLNNQKVLDQNLGPLTVKYAQGEAERLGIPADGPGAGVDQAKLFVGSLPKSATEEEVRNVFGPYGTLEEVFLMRDDQKQGKGCAFIKYAFKEEAFHAIQALNQKFTVPGAPRPLEVRFATNKKAQTPGQPAAPGAAPKAPQSKNWTEYFTAEGRPYYYNSVTGQTQWDKPAEMDAPARPAGGANNGPQPHGPPGANVFVFHVPNEWSENDLVQHFAHYGNIISSRIATDRDSGRNRGFAFVSYDNVNSAVAAVQGMNGFTVSGPSGAGKRLKVQIKKGEETFAPAAQGVPQQMPQQQQPQYGGLPAANAYGAFAGYGQQR